MAFQVQPATHADLHELAKILVSAHVEDELVAVMMGAVPYAAQVEWYADEFRKVWQDKSALYYKVTETANK